MSKRVTITAKEEKKHEARRDSDSVSAYISNVNSMDYRPNKRILVQKMLQEESELFSKDGEIGDAKGLQMNINLINSRAENIYSRAPTSLPRGKTVRRRPFEQRMGTEVTISVFITSCLCAKEG